MAGNGVRGTLDGFGRRVSPFVGFQGVPPSLLQGSSGIRLLLDEQDQER
jgi:hypothetical protein